VNGPYPVSQISDKIDPETIGVYMLSRGGRTVHYVGRSDSDLQKETRYSSSLSDYSHFWFEYASSPMQAYKRECVLYHYHDPVDNTNHPAVPSGTNWRCPVNGCEWN